jgi:hypothetical protein
LTTHSLVDIAAAAGLGRYAISSKDGRAPRATKKPMLAKSIGHSM